MPALSLRDDLFLLAHDARGKPLTSEGRLSAGLAGATLIDLLVTGRVAVIDGRLDVVDPTVTGDPETDATLEVIGGNTAPAGPRAWVSWISHGAYARIADALVARGLVQRSMARRLGVLPAQRYAPVAEDDLVRVRSRVRFAIHSPEPPDPSTAALCGLARALRLERSLLLSAPRADLRSGLARANEASDLTVRQVVHAVETVAVSAAFG
jgi:transcriptional regulator with XRE-family HTH domain